MGEVAFGRYTDWRLAMSYVIAATDRLAAASENLQNIGSALRSANGVAAAQTSAIAAPAADEVSAAITALLGTHAQEFQAASAQATAFHDEFVNLLNGGAAQYVSTEVANATQTSVNAPAQVLLVGTGQGSAAVDLADLGSVWNNLKSIYQYVYHTEDAVKDGLEEKILPNLGWNTSSSIGLPGSDGNGGVQDKSYVSVSENLNIPLQKLEAAYPSLSQYLPQNVPIAQWSATLQSDNNPTTGRYFLAMTNTPLGPLMLDVSQYPGSSQIQYGVELFTLWQPSGSFSVSSLLTQVSNWPTQLQTQLSNLSTQLSNMHTSTSISTLDSLLTDNPITQYVGTSTNNLAIDINSLFTSYTGPLGTGPLAVDINNIIGPTTQTVQNSVLGLINAPSDLLTGGPMIGNGSNGAPGTGENGGNGGWLYGNGGNGGSGAPGQPGGHGGNAGD